MRRRLICSTCPFNSTNAVKDGYISHRTDEHCIMCGCPIARKTASMDSDCGISCCNSDSTCSCKKPDLKEYNKKHNITMPVKWAAYKIEENG